MPMGDEAVFNNYGLFQANEISEGDHGFAGKTFKEPVKFHDTFAGKAIFKGCIFEKYMDFSNATFNGEVDFSGAVFKQGASFRNATFITRGADVSFENAVFLPFDRNEVDALEQDKEKNIAEVDFSGAKFGQEYERTHGEYEVWFGKKDSGPVLHYRKKGTKEQTATIDISNDLNKALANTPLKQYEQSISQTRKTAQCIPSKVNFLNCRFGAFDFEKVTDEMAQKCIADETARLKLLSNPENDPNLTAFKKFMADKGYEISERENSGIIQILSRHLSSKELEQLRVTAGMNVSFKKAQFFNAGVVDFVSATFANAGGVDFGGATFANAGGVDFGSATFANAGWVDFESATFANAGWVSFQSATFANAGLVDFQSATFANAGGVDFGYATFANAGGVYFQAARFANAGGVYFVSATFANAGGVDFGFATFEKTEEVLFTFTIFLCQNAVDFSLAKFPNQSEQPFGGCFFGGLKTAEPKVKFNGVTLPKTTFAKGSSRDKSVALRDRLKESGVPLPPKTEVWIQELEKAGKDRIPAETPIFDEDIVVSWKGISEETAKNLTFYQVNLHGSLFDKNTLQFVQLVSPEWLEKDGRKMLYAETLLDKWQGEEKTKNLKDLYQQYLQLKNAMEIQKDHEAAGNFHYGEMEMRRLLGGKGLAERILLGMYKLFLGYGERPLRAFGWLAGLVFVIVPALLYLSALCRGTVGMATFLNPEGWKTLSIGYFRGVAELITPFSWKESISTFSTSNWHRYAVIILGQVLMYIQLPLFVLAVRRRFKR